MEEHGLSSDLSLYLDHVPARYWGQMLDLVEAGACSHWATVHRGRPQGTDDDPLGRVLWLHPRKNGSGVYLVMAISLASGIRAASGDDRIRLDHGDVRKLAWDLYDGSVEFFTNRDVDLLVQTYLFGSVRYRR